MRPGQSTAPLSPPVNNADKHRWGEPEGPPHLQRLSQSAHAELDGGSLAHVDEVAVVQGDRHHGGDVLE